MSLLLYLFEVAGVVGLLYFADHLVRIVIAYRRDAKMRRYLEERRSSDEIEVFEPQRLETKGAGWLESEPGEPAPKDHEEA